MFLADTYLLLLDSLSLCTSICGHGFCICKREQYIYNLASHVMPTDDTYMQVHAVDEAGSRSMLLK